MKLLKTTYLASIIEHHWEALTEELSKIMQNWQDTIPFKMQYVFQMML